jgi:hypothetical protein
MTLLKFIVFFAAATVAAAFYDKFIFVVSYLFMNTLNMILNIFGLGSLLYKKK